MYVGREVGDVSRASGELCSERDCDELSMTALGDESVALGECRRCMNEDLGDTEGGEGDLFDMAETLDIG